MFPLLSRSFLVFIIAATLRLGLIVVNHQPDVLPEQNRAFQGADDYTSYAIGAEDFLRTGHFENSLFLVRPALYPLMIVALGQSTLAVLIANALLGSFIAPVTLLIARGLGLSLRGAMLTGFIVALDPPSVVYSASFNAEPLANFILALALLALIHAVYKSNRSLPRRVVWAVSAGVLLALSAWARPLPYLLWIPLAGIVFMAVQPLKARILLAGAFALVCAVGVGAWIVHNAFVFNNPTYSTIGVYNLLYYRAASVERLGSGTDIQDVYAELSRRVEAGLGNDTTNVDSNTRYTHYTASVPLAAQMQRVSMDVFMRYPLEYVATIPVGLYRILLKTNALSGVRGVIDVVWNAALLIGAAAGTWIMVRRKQWTIAALVVVVCGYVLAATLIVQTSGIDTRARTPMIPMLAVATVVAVESFRKRPPENRHSI